MLSEFTEITVDKARSSPEIRQSLSRGLQGFPVLVDPDQHAAGGAALQDQPGVSSSAQCAVQVNPARSRIQEPNDLLRQDRQVAEGIHSDSQRGQRFGFQREVLLVLGVDTAVELLAPDIETLAHADKPDIPLKSGMGT